MRNSFKYPSKADCPVIATGLKLVYPTTTLSEAEDRFADFKNEWEQKYPAMIRLWERTWGEFDPFLQFDREIRRIVCTTKAIESVNARIRNAVKAREHFPTEQSALKCVYMALMALNPTSQERARWTQRWKPALNAFDIAFGWRLSAHM